ncbi:MAG: site-2 protease family protein, partial [Oscillospiraceae bacterium]|nr:site-2 protease family protein [Oscillospiraceae bacterium]
NQLSGPIGVTDVVTQVVAQSGSALFENLLFLITMITINVGIFNLLPLPALDGGRLLFVAAEGISRRKVPAKFESLVHAVGFALLILLMIVIAFSDVFKLFRG